VIKNIPKRKKDWSDQHSSKRVGAWLCPTWRSCNPIPFGK